MLKPYTKLVQKTLHLFVHTIADTDMSTIKSYKDLHKVRRHALSCVDRINDQTIINLTPYIDYELTVTF